VQDEVEAVHSGVVGAWQTGGSSSNSAAGEAEQQL
jgi:hypothetical protein